MRFLPPSGLVLRVAVCAFSLGLWGLCGCSLSLEDPEDDARKKLAKLVEPSWELLEGRWVGDSTYTLFDTQAEPLAGRLVMDIFPDGSFQAEDRSRILFSGRKLGNAGLAADTLILSPTAGPPAKDTFAVRLRFLGNWLELGRASDRRQTHFHKDKPFDSLRRQALLDSGIWLRRFRRILVDTGRAEDLRREFDYLDFRGDSLRRETRRDGIPSVQAGPLVPDGRLWTWTPAGSAIGLMVDLFQADSLRLWIFAGERPDSGYSLYTRSKGPHPFDFDMSPFLGHVRTDSIRIAFATVESHYGRYYDLEFASDRTVRTYTNMPDMPRFRSWEIDSGFLFMKGDSTPRTRFKAAFDTTGGLSLSTDAGTAFPRGALLMSTRVDGSRFPAHPLERFETANYLHLAVGPDTLAYYFLGSLRRGTLDEYEAARIDGGDTLWAAWRLDPGLETFGSGQDSFFFAFQGRNAGLGRFTCRATPALALAIRTTDSPDPRLAKGLVQGTCRVTAAEKPPADSTLEVTGEFRMRKRLLGQASPLWRLP